MYYSYHTDLIKKDGEFKYYLLGLIASDGYISTRYNRIELAFKESDVGILKMIRDLIVPGKKIVYKRKQKAYKLLLDNKDIHREICKYINAGNKTHSLIFPYGIPDVYIKDFIRGYLDGDGNIGVKRGQRKFDTGMKYYYGLRLRILGTRALLQGMHMNLKRLCGLKKNVHPYKKGSENVYYIEYAYSSASRVLNYLYDNATYFLDRKKKVFEHISELDSDTLGSRYGTQLGHYNMQESAKADKI